MKNNKYEIIWSLLLLLSGGITIYLGLIIYPLSILLLIIGFYLFIIGIINILRLLLWYNWNVDII